MRGGSSWAGKGGFFLRNAVLDLSLGSGRRDVRACRAGRIKEDRQLRQPKLGEMLRCHTCGKDWKRVDHEWIEFFNKQSEAERENLYDRENDIFLGYDGCEGDEKRREDIGLREDQRSYIRGTSYRPY